METARTVILNTSQIQQRIQRIAYQLLEDNLDESGIIVAGIAKNGYVFAEKIAAALMKISSLDIRLIEVVVDKHSQTNKEITLPLSKNDLQGKVIILVDDVLNSGKTMMYALRPFLNADIKKIRTVVLVDRNHKHYPVAADYSGLSLATTLREHVSVEFGKEEAAYLN